MGVMATEDAGLKGVSFLVVVVMVVEDCRGRGPRATISCTSCTHIHPSIHPCVCVCDLLCEVQHSRKEKPRVRLVDVQHLVSHKGAQLQLLPVGRGRRRLCGAHRGRVGRACVPIWP